MEGLAEGVRLAGRYELIKPLRSGGRADVWQAQDRLSGAAVAVKFSRCGPLGELSAEYENLQTLSHPAIVVAHDLATAGGYAFLVLELIDGIELSQYLGADRRVWLPMLRPVVDALMHAHGRGVVHGDLKLENMLVTGDKRVRLVDFSGRAGSGAADDVRALGVVMSELATGRPVFDPRRARLPAALARLITDMSGDSARIGLTEVADRIDAVLNDDMNTGDTEQFERIEPVARQSRAGGPGTRGREGRRSLFWPWLVAVAVVSVAAVSTLIFWPRLLPDSGTPETAVDRVDEAQARLESLARQTQEESASVYQKWLALEQMNVSTWAELRARRALELLQQGEQLASELDYVAALRSLGESKALFDALLQQAPGIAADRREAGWQAYRSGDAETAATHFRVALAIEPDDEKVRAALNRTAFLEQITALIRQARELEANGDLSGALAAMNEALRMDSANTEVEIEVSRLQSKLKANDFQATMSKVYAALRAGDYPAARKSLTQASGMRPAAPEVRDAMTQIELAERAGRMTRLRARAVEAETTENWETAIGLYSELLALDPALVLAQQGRDRSRRLASLTARAETLLETALTKDDLRRQADDLVEQIANVEAHAPMLQALGLRLTDALRLSRLPVNVRFQSDNLTDIQVYRVARLGAFESHEMKLMPGQYTVVGTRAGYRDVRARLVVEAGKEPAPLLIRCEEQI